VPERTKAPRGTFDVLPGNAEQRSRLERAAAEIFGRAGFGRIDTPIFEDTDLFRRGVGESTDIVEKEMFTFEDLGGRSITLRPEATAAICRAYVEHGMHKLAQPVRLWTSGPFFRYEAPQAGRFRQFHQIDLETIGTDDPLADAESIALLAELLTEMEVPGVECQVSSLGSREARAAYREELIAYLRANEGDLSEDVRRRIDMNPLRAFDAKDESTQGVMENAPKLVEQLEGSDAERFAEVRSLLEDAGVEHSIDPTLVRGLDYYSQTVFAFTCDHLGAQSEIGGGGRYDGLVAELGGPETPAIGWAAGIERILLALNAPDPEPSRDVFVAVGAPEEKRRAMALVSELRRAGLSAELDLAGRSMKGQLKQANRIGARATLILGSDDGLELRDMESGEQRPIEPERVLDALAEGRGD
jgi:histidyl-tRNA synthetase